MAIHFYRERGFLPWALVQFPCTSGLGHARCQGLFFQSELIEAFSLEGISRTNSVFNLKKDDPKFFTDPKALSMNAHYLRTLPVKDLVPFVSEVLKQEDLWNPRFETDRQAWFFNTIDIVRQRFHTTTDFATLGRPYFSEAYPIDPKALSKHILDNPGMKNSCMNWPTESIGWTPTGRTPWRPYCGLC